MTEKQKTWHKIVAIGDEVSYSDVNLWFARRGKLVQFVKGKFGGDCLVLWAGNPNLIEECSANLVSWK